MFLVTKKLSGEKLLQMILQQRGKHDKVDLHQLDCTDRDWCDFVLRTDKDIHIQRIQRDKKWWGLQMAKLQRFYFSAFYQNWRALDTEPVVTQ